MIERVYPGVFVTEIASGVHPIDGVQTSDGERGALSPSAHIERQPPGWADAAPSDPGRTLLDVFAFLGDALIGRGVVDGLAIGAEDSRVAVSPGSAVGPDGHRVDRFADCTIVPR